MAGFASVDDAITEAARRRLCDIGPVPPVPTPPAAAPPRLGAMSDAAELDEIEGARNQDAARTRNSMIEVRPLQASGS